MHSGHLLLIYVPELAVADLKGSQGVSTQAQRAMGDIYICIDPNEDTF